MLFKSRSDQSFEIIIDGIFFSFQTTSLCIRITIPDYVPNASFLKLVLLDIPDRLGNCWSHATQGTSHLNLSHQAPFSDPLGVRCHSHQSSPCQPYYVPSLTRGVILGIPFSQ